MVNTVKMPLFFSMILLSCAEPSRVVELPQEASQDLDPLFRVENARIYSTCIDSCDSTRLEDVLELDIWSKESVRVDVDWLDWSESSRALKASNIEFGNEALDILADDSLALKLRHDVETFCDSARNLKSSGRVLLRLNEAEFEIEADVVLSGGGDTCG